jgi:hypothetical protein
MSFETVSDVKSINSDTEIHVMGGKTGREIHLGSARSSVTNCGIWLQYQLINFKVFLPVTCEKCLRQVEARKK